MENHLGIGVESVWDTPIAPDIWLEILSEAIRREPSYQPVESIRSVGPRAYSLGSVVSRGPFRAICNYQDLPSLVFLMFGDSDLTDADPIYTHTIPQASAPAFVRPPLTFEVHRDEGGSGLAHKYSGGTLTELGITVAVDELVECTGAMLGSGTEGVGSPSTPVYNAFDLIQPTEAVVEFDSTEIDVERFSVSMAWSADEPKKLGATTLARQPKDAGSLMVTGSFTLLEHNAAIWTKFDNFSEAVLQLKATAAAARDFEVNLGNCVLNQATPALDGRNVPKPTVEFSCRLDDSLLTPVQFVGINGLATLP